MEAKANVRTPGFQAGVNKIIAALKSNLVSQVDTMHINILANMPWDKRFASGTPMSPAGGNQAASMVLTPEHIGANSRVTQSKFRTSSRSSSRGSRGGGGKNIASNINQSF